MEHSEHFHAVYPYADLQRQAAQDDADELNVARQSVPGCGKEETFGERYSLMRMLNSRQQTEQKMRVAPETDRESTKEDNTGIVNMSSSISLLQECGSQTQ